MYEHDWTTPREMAVVSLVSFVVSVILGVPVTLLLMWVMGVPTHG